MHNICNLFSCLAGCLLLARNGICVVEDVTLHKKDTKEVLQRGVYHHLCLHMTYVTRSTKLAMFSQITLGWIFINIL